MNKQDVELPKIVWEYGNIPTNAKEGEYLLISSDVDGEEPDPSFVVASFYNGFLDTGTYIPEEDMVAYAYLGSQRRSHRRCAALSRSGLPGWALSPSRQHRLFLPYSISIGHESKIFFPCLD